MVPVVASRRGRGRQQVLDSVGGGRGCRGDGGRALVGRHRSRRRKLIGRLRYGAREIHRRRTVVDARPLGHGGPGARAQVEHRGRGRGVAAGRGRVSAGAPVAAVFGRVLRVADVPRLKVFPLVPRTAVIVVDVVVVVVDVVTDDGGGGGRVGPGRQAHRLLLLLLLQLTLSAAVLLLLVLALLLLVVETVVVLLVVVVVVFLVAGPVGFRLRIRVLGRREHAQRRRLHFAVPGCRRRRCSQQSRIGHCHHSTCNPYAHDYVKLQVRYYSIIVILKSEKNKYG